MLTWLVGRRRGWLHVIIERRVACIVAVDRIGEFETFGCTDGEAVRKRLFPSCYGDEGQVHGTCVFGDAGRGAWMGGKVEGE